VETPAETLSKRLPEIVRACRLGDYGDAASALNKCIPYLEGLQTEPALKAKKKPLLDKINYSLETVVLMMGRKDWVAVADIIEFEVLPILEEIKRPTA
jgi:hypothetical protein